MRRPAFNGTRDYNKLQWIFAKLMSLSRDIHIRTHRSGAFWKILNEQQIREQWPGVKQQIKEMYEDPLVEDILKRHEQNLTDRKSTRLNSSHVANSYAVFCLKKKIDTN